ncbi:hypothetical protein BRD09_04245 [Halobacteriales archaeon SW_10_68_16]|nr:MAG: hypothetical protein BRD09_04245 [Halobacteriales archaeon SW_10_68_16]
MGPELVELGEGAVVQEVLKALAGREFALLVLGLDALLAAALPGLLAEPARNSSMRSSIVMAVSRPSWREHTVVA